jgi:AcrR family transcriptional regulator
MEPSVPTTKQKRLEQKRATILSAAEEILIRRGKNATMGDIAQALDMDKSSLYYYFKGIPEILNAILDKEYYDFSLNIQDIRRENKSHVDVLKEMARVILEFYHDNIEILLIILTRIFPLFLEPGNREESTAINAYMDSYHLANDLMLEEVRLAVRDRELVTEFSPEMVLQTLRGAIFGVCAVWRRGKPERGAIPAVIDQLFRMYV